MSAENVVATIEIPSNHHGIFRPERKNSLVFLPERFATTRPMIKNMTKKERMRIQSSVSNFISGNFYGLSLTHPIVAVYSSGEEIDKLCDSADILIGKLADLIVGVNAYLIEFLFNIGPNSHDTG